MEARKREPTQLERMASIEASAHALAIELEQLATEARSAILDPQIVLELASHAERARHLFLCIQWDSRRMQRRLANLPWKFRGEP